MTEQAAILPFSQVGGLYERMEPSPIYDDWADWMRAGSYAEKTIQERPQLIARLEAHIRKPALAASTRDLTKFLAQPWQPATRQAHQSTLRAFYRWA